MPFLHSLRSASLLDDANDCLSRASQVVCLETWQLAASQANSALRHATARLPDHDDAWAFCNGVFCMWVCLNGADRSARRLGCCVHAWCRHGQGSGRQLVGSDGHALKMRGGEKSERLNDYCLLYETFSFICPKWGKPGSGCV